MTVDRGAAGSRRSMKARSRGPLLMKEDEIEDLVGDVKLTDSQKSVATTNVYSMDFTDSSSDRNNSSGKNTYVIEYDSDDSDVTGRLYSKKSVLNLNDTQTAKTREKNTNTFKRNKNENSSPRISGMLQGQNLQYDRNVSRSTSTNLQCSFVSQETFTQTSKTIFELAQTNGVENSTIETQTSRISIIENKTIEYRIEVSGSRTNFSRTEISKDSRDKMENVEIQYDQTPATNCHEIEPLKLSPSDREESSFGNVTDRNSIEILEIIDDLSKLETEKRKELYDTSSEFEDTSKFDSDFDEESLTNEYCEAKSNHRDDISEASVPKSVDNDVEELYYHLEKSLDLRTLARPEDFDIGRHVSLTPLTEESTVAKNENIVDITPIENTVTSTKEDSSKNVLFVNNSGVQIKMLPNEDAVKKEPFKLPPIYHQSCPSSPHLNSLFSNTTNRLGKAGPLTCLFENHRIADRWEIGTKNLASGESVDTNEKIGPPGKLNEICCLPSIHIEGQMNYGDSNTLESSRNPMSSIISSETPHETISIQDKIRELKMSKDKKQRVLTKYSNTTPESRSLSPGSVSPDEGRLCDAAERGCENLCVAVIKRLQSPSWFEVVEVLEELPKVMEKFWCVISEQRIADIIRQVTVHVDSPRTHVARTACHTLAMILKNTNYTKKPDFYEAVTSLLVKTGSFSKPVRRAANVALDNIVSGVELSHAVTALCIHGVSHKSPLVRCAAARLLVVCTALAGGGRELLRTRPPTAAQARRHALRSLSALLDDKNSDARKYAERLYSMLRPLTNFEAYYLTDVEVDVASKQMKKYDHLLLNGSLKDTR